MPISLSIKSCSPLTRLDEKEKETYRNHRPTISPFSMCSWHKPVHAFEFIYIYSKQKHVSGSWNYELRRKINRNIRKIHMKVSFQMKYVNCFSEKCVFDQNFVIDQINQWFISSKRFVFLQNHYWTNFQRSLHLCS